VGSVAVLFFSGSGVVLVLFVLLISGSVEVVFAAEVVLLLITVTYLIYYKIVINIKNMPS